MCVKTTRLGEIQMRSIMQQSNVFVLFSCYVGKRGLDAEKAKHMMIYMIYFLILIKQINWMYNVHICSHCS